MLFMLATGSVKAQQKISAIDGGLPGASLDLADEDWFGWKVAGIGAVDRENGVVGLVVMTYYSKVCFMQLNVDGTVNNAYRLRGEYNPPEKPYLTTGGVASVGDVDGNGVVDIVIGAPEVGIDSGAVYVLLMSREDEEEGAQTLVQQKISKNSGGLQADLKGNRTFGESVEGLGDLDGDGTPDLAVGYLGHGLSEVYILLLTPVGTVKAENVVSPSVGGFNGPVVHDDFFGSSLAVVKEQGDSEEGVLTLAVGAYGDTDSGENSGAVYILDSRSVVATYYPRWGQLLVLL